VTVKEKLLKLRELLAGCGGAVIAYSGGVDSTFLARVAQEVLGERVLAVTACSETYPAHEQKAALETAQQLGLPHQTIYTDELANEQFAANPPERCYFCKKEMFSKLLDIARQHELACVLDGANYDDQLDFRPGMQAARELGIRSPLKEAGLTKEDIRKLSREMGLPTWDKPSYACLSSRLPYGERITREKLTMIGEAEDYLRSMGINVLRVRHHGNMARIEVNCNDFPRIIDLSGKIVEKLKTLGYSYVSLDLQGFRSGSMNEVLDVPSVEL
jgi:uncharacterized protein